MIDFLRLKFVNLCLAIFVAAGCLFAGMPAAVSAAAQVLSLAYTQNFDALRNSGSGAWNNDGTLPGWYGSRATIAADNGSSGAAGLYSYGTSGGPERGLGAIPKNSTGAIYIGVLLYNDAGTPISELYIAYTGEQWRNGGGGVQRMSFSYQISSAPITSLTAGSWTNYAALDFASPVTGGTAGALDGNLPSNRRSLAEVVPLNLAAGDYLMLRWTNINDQGADHGLAIDDLLVSRNLPPRAVADSYTAAEDTPLVVTLPGVLGNDTDPGGNPITAEWVSGPAHGVLSLNADGSFLYTPEADWNGADGFDYRAFDGEVYSPPVTVTLTVAAVNDVPTAAADAYSLEEDGSLSAPAAGVLANDADVDGDALAAVLDATTLHGALTLNADGSFSYTPEADWNGNDSFTYHATDGQASSGVVMVALAVAPVNDAPALIAPLPDRTHPARSPFNFNAAPFFSDIDAGDVLTFSAQLANGDPLPGWLKIDPASGALSGAPDNAEVGVYTLRVFASDGQATICDDFVLTVQQTQFNLFIPMLRR